MIKNEPAYTLLSGKETDNGKWQQLLDRSSTASYFQTPECFRFYASLSFLRPFVYAIEENGEYRALVCGYCISDGRGIKKYMSRRAIIPGGALIAGDCQEEALARLLNHVKESLHHRAIYIEFRNYTGYDKQKATFEQCGFRYHPHLNFHIKTTDPALATKQLSSTKRRDIKLSLKEGAVIERSSSAEDIRALYAILEDLYQTKIKTPLFPFEFFDTLSKQPGSHFFLVKYNGKVIGGSVCVSLPSKKLYEWFVCGQDNSYKNIYPSTLATWAAIEYAAGNDLAVFDMMGAGKPGEGYGVRDFKARFGGVLVEHGRFMHICNHFLYKMGEQAIQFLKNKSGKTASKAAVAEKKIVTDYTLVDPKEWSDFVVRHPNGNIFQTPEMHALFNSMSTFEPYLFVSYTGRGSINGCLLAVIQKEHRGIAGRLSSRAVIYGGPLVTNNDPVIADNLLWELNKRIRSKAIYSQFRNLTDCTEFSAVFANNDFVFEEHYDILLDLHQDIDTLTNKLHKERRRNIRIAEKEGLRFGIIENEDDIQELIRLLKLTYNRVKVPMSYDDLFRYAKQCLGDKVVFFGAWYNDRMIAGQVRLCFKNTVYAWYAGSDNAYFSKKPNDFLLWNVICWSKQNGYGVFDFGGAGKPGVEYGVRDYKLKFGGELVNYGRYERVNKKLLMGTGKLLYRLYRKI